MEKNTGFFATRAQQHDLLQLDAVLTRSLSRLSYTPRTILGNVNQSELVCVDAALDQPEEASLFHYGCGMLRIGDPMFDLAYSMVFSDVCFSQASIWINTYEAIRREFLCQPNNLSTAAVADGEDVSDRWGLFFRILCTQVMVSIQH